MRKSDAAEIYERQRLERLDEFERFQFDHWLLMSAESCGLSPEQLLTVLHHITVEGAVTGFTVRDGGRSCSYDRHAFTIGLTPIELACLIFTADHWHKGVPIPEREVQFNPKRAAARAEMFRDTWRYRKHIEAVAKKV